LTDAHQPLPDSWPAWSVLLRPPPLSTAGVAVCRPVLVRPFATMVGFRLPDYMAESNAVGYHFHALTEDRTAGGHVLDCEATNVSVEVDAIDTWQVELPPR
jgi:hypothetical protein